MCLRKFIFATGLVALLGALFVALKSLLQAFQLYVWSRFKDGKPLLSYGKWAVVTGGTDGIGKALATELAKNGLSVCFVARDQRKAEEVSNEIKQVYKVETKVIIANLCDVSTYDNIKRGLQEIDDIGILVNCAGVSLGNKLFNQCDPKDCLELISTNISALVWLTREIAPKMEANQRGLVLNIGSMSSTLIPPRLALYAASKDFMSHLTESLDFEFKAHNVRVKYLEAGFVRTKMTCSEPSIQKIAELNAWAFLTPESFAKSTIASLKITDLPREFISDFYHWLFYIVNRVLLLGAENRPARLAVILSQLKRTKKLFSSLKSR